MSLHRGQVLQMVQASPVEEMQNQHQSVTDVSVDNAMTCEQFEELSHNADILVTGGAESMEEQEFYEELPGKTIKADASEMAKTQSQKAVDTPESLDAEDDSAIKVGEDMGG